MDVLEPGSVTVYHNIAINKVHRAYRQSELTAKRIKYLSEGYQDRLALAPCTND